MSDNAQTAGSVVALWRYPVKSMLGERLGAGGGAGRGLVRRGDDPLDPEADTRDIVMPNPFFDLAALHLLTTASLERLRELYPQGRFEPQRFRPNIGGGA